MNRTIAAASSSSSRNKGVLLLAAVFGILSAMLMFAFLNTRGGDNSEISEQLNSGVGAETVIVVTRNINVGERITPDMLGTKTVPAVALIDGWMKDSEASKLEGQVAIAPLYAGEQVIHSKVSTYEGQNSLTWKVPEGTRALGLMVPHEGWIAGGLPQPGDRVDVLGITVLTTVDPLTGQEKPDLLAGYIAQDVQVLAVSQTVVKTVPKVTETKDGEKATTEISTEPGAQAVLTDEDGATYEKAISITLALAPDLVAKVALIDAMDDDVGQYRIVVRQKGDADPISGKTTYSYQDIFAR